MTLSVNEINSLKSTSQDYWVSDEKGLRLLVKSNGSKYWRFKYRFLGKQKTLAFGVYPDVSLKDARIKRDKARILVAEGKDPSHVKQNEKLELTLADGVIFSHIATEWWEYEKGLWSDSHAIRIWSRLKNYAFGSLDTKPIAEILPQDVISVIESIEAKDTPYIAARVLQDIKRVFRYAAQRQKIKYNPTYDLTGIVKRRKTIHRASLPIQELGKFLVDLECYPSHGRKMTKLAIELLAYTFLRPGELRWLGWKEIDWENCLIRIPPEKMKMNREHLVPISTTSFKLLKQIFEITGQYELIFPSERSREKPMSDNTMRKAIFKIGYDGNCKNKSRMTPHGFRANASSVLNENGFNPDAIERQLAHMEVNQVRGSYTHHAQYLEERKSMMQWWSDFLDGEKAKAK